MSEALDVRSLLDRINHRLAALRRALAHDHHDETWWSAHDVTAPQAQYERHILRWLAHLLHVDRATARGRIHGAFPNLDAQRVWLAKTETHSWGAAARYVGLSEVATLVALRAGRLGGVANISVAR